MFIRRVFEIVSNPIDGFKSNQWENESENFQSGWQNWLNRLWLDEDWDSFQFKWHHNIIQHGSRVLIAIAFLC